MNEESDREIANFEIVIKVIEQLRGGLVFRKTREELKEIIKILHGCNINLSYPLDEIFRIFRGRIENDETVKSANDLSYSPQEYSNNYGRCHSPKSTIFYGANNIDTVLSELSPEINDTIYIGEAQLKENYNSDIAAIGELDHIRRYDKALYGGDGTFNTMKSKISDYSDVGSYMAYLVDAFFAESFSKPASKNSEYKLTSALIELLLSLKDGESSVFDGVAYPSVAHRGGNNFVISPDHFDTKFKWILFYKLKITGYFGYGIYLKNLIATGQCLNSGKEIEWVLNNK